MARERALAREAGDTATSASKSFLWVSFVPSGQLLKGTSVLCVPPDPRYHFQGKLSEQSRLSFPA